MFWLVVLIPVNFELKDVKLLEEQVENPLEIF